MSFRSFKTKASFYKRMKMVLIDGQTHQRATLVHCANALRACVKGVLNMYTERD